MPIDGYTSNRQSITWLRVAFCLDLVPSIEDVYYEFQQVSQKSLEDAIYRCTFSQRKRPLEFESIGIVGSLPAYAKNDKRWVVNLLTDRKYIYHTLMEMFALIWGRLLESTVQRACEKLSKGLTSLGLVASIRAMHKWLLSDFMTSVIRRTLSSNWNLEALTMLPGNDTDSSFEATLAQDFSSSLITLTTHVLKSSILDIVYNEAEVFGDIMPLQSSQIVGRVDCSAFDRPTGIPLYHVFNEMIKDLLAKSLSIDRRENLSTESSIESFIRNQFLLKASEDLAKPSSLSSRTKLSGRPGK
jgi:hypothetical protein